MLRLEDAWVWDCWVADDGERYHLFVLQAPRSLGDPALRHGHARVGHATSSDLRDWTYHGECLGPSHSGFDDRAIWTGSVLAARGRWWMFYTGVSESDGHGGFGQRIGCAVSDDLHRWERVGDGPVLRLDPDRYRACGPGPDPAGPTWRDPFVFADPGGDGWHMLITAAAAGADPADAGVLAHATSPDLLNWEVGPPRTRPGAGFRHLEVPHSVVIDGRPVLTFTCHPREATAARVAASGRYCTWSVPGPGPTGPWDAAAARPFTADPALFAAAPVRDRDGGWILLGFRNLEHDGGDGFAIGDPVPVTLDDEGYLRAR